MSEKTIIGLHHWFDTPPGRYLLAWEQACFDEAVVDVFGYHSLQAGMPLLDGLRANRMPHRWLALDTWPQADAPAGQAPHLLAHTVALPFPDNSLDLVLLPHALEFSHDPHAALREVARVLVPEGRVVITGFNPISLWGLRQQRQQLYRRLAGGRGRLFLPNLGEFIAPWRMRDWLKLLNFELDAMRYGCWRPAVRTQHWLDRYAWMDGLGERLWPVLGAAYFIVGIKRVHGMRLLEPTWRSTPQRAGATVPLARRGAENHHQTEH